jgi:hypothetical protein
MNGLTNFLIESILLEADSINKVIVVYSGRFQPFHKGHFATYQNLVKKFGSDNVYIGTSNVTDSNKSPFNFNEKKAIMMKMFGIPSSKIVNVRNPYAPSEILNKYDEKKTGLIVVVGEKDENRLGGKYFTPYKGKVEEPYLDRGYVYAAPSESNPISGTDVRYWLSAGNEADRKKNFTKAYPKFDDQIFKMITLKLKKLKECINEEISLNVKVGDTLLMGKFKNKKVLVKDIGKDEYGMPTINGKKAVTFRIPKKESLKESIIVNEFDFGGGLPGGAFTGLTSADGYINGSPDPKDVKKTSKKLNKKGDDQYEPVDENWDSEYEEVDEIAVQNDFIPGGLAKGKTLIDLAKKWDSKGYYKPTQFAKEYIKPQLIKGIKVEMEHTTDVRIATEIAMDHLWEDLKYYDKLATIEAENIIKEESGIGAIAGNEGNSTTGYTWNPAWDDYDNAKYYLNGLPGWKTKQEKPSEYEIKRTVDQKLPVDNHDDSVHKYNRTLKYGYKSPFDFLNGDSKSIVGTTDAYPNKYDNQPGKDERINMDPTVDIDGDIIKDEERHIAKSVKLRNPIKESIGLKDLEKQRMKLFIQALKMMPQSPAQMKIRAEIDRLGKEIQKLQKENINESLLVEGGAYGHMNHPFDIEMNLTFGDLKNIVTKALNGDLDTVREKTDGQALAISWVNGRLVAARNKSHLKNKGEGAMTIGQVADKFAGRGGLTDAYNFAMQDLSKAIGALSEPQRKKIFKDGACFMNLEVIYPTSVNVIPYNQPLLVFHGTFEYDTDGSIVGENQQAASILGGMIKQINAHVQSKYTIQGPPMQKLPKSEDLSKMQGKYLGMISKLQSEFGLSDSSGVADYHQSWWTNFVDKNAKGLDAQQKIGLVKRWAFGDKSFRIADIKDPKIQKWADSTDKNDQAKISKQNLMRFEEIFLGVGAEVLSFMDSVLTANPAQATKQMLARLESTIKDVKASGDPKKIAKLKLELSRMQALGGFDKIVPNEGLVFVYGGNTYKLTGAFAPLNQILGIFFSK